MIHVLFFNTCHKCVFSRDYSSDEMELLIKYAFRFDVIYKYLSNYDVWTISGVTRNLRAIDNAVKSTL